MKVTRLAAENLQCFCGAPATLRDSSVIYGKSYGPAWVCSRWPECDGYVGCHPGTNKPLGNLADNRTRAARKQAHSAFDHLWKSKGIRRTDAYRWMQKVIGLTSEQAHIGIMSREQCETLLKHVLPVLRGETRLPGR